MQTPSLAFRSWQQRTKVPKLTAWFWVIKILTTAMGEATSDYAVNHYNPYLAVIGGFIFFCLTIGLQFATHRYRPSIYWLAAVGVSIYGTMAADVVHIQFHVAYLLSAVILGVLLGLLFFWWYRSEGTLGFHSIASTRREMFYWAAVLTTFAFGTATGDFTATSLHLGYLTAGLLFSVLFALCALGYFLGRLNSILAFWLAYIVTRPLGASFADWLGKPHSVGGKGYGDGIVALILTLGIVLCVGYMEVSRIDQQAVSQRLR